MTGAFSLRVRLSLIIFLPLLVVATLVGLWQLNNARKTAAEVFDRSLLSAALAVASDVAISGGDALSARTRDILADTSGGLVYYHVYAPDGVIVAGYATPPVGIPRPEPELVGPTYFDAVYLGRNVSGARLQNLTEIDGFSGIFTTTVWQDTVVRRAFVRDLVTRSMITISGLILSLALIVWFGVRLGLRPLLDLENAIARRSSDELTPIKRAVPAEVEGIVDTLNRLFAQVSRSMTAQSEFISNAAHQLRNPIAGVLSLAEAVNSAPSAQEAKRRSADLLAAAQETAELSQKLLLLERARAISPASAHQAISLDEELRDWVAHFQLTTETQAKIELRLEAELGDVEGDPTMLREALRNILDNAIRHGGPDMTRIVVCGRRAGDHILLSVSDNGRGIPRGDMAAARERFRQLSPTSSSGLGVSIVEAIVQGHGGDLKMIPLQPGLRVEFKLPVDASAEKSSRSRNFGDRGRPEVAGESS